MVYVDIDKELDNFDRLYEKFHEAPFDVLRAEVLSTEERIRNVVGPDADYARIPDMYKEKEEP